MAQTPFSLLLLRRLTLSSQNPKPHFLPSLLKPFSTSQPSPSSTSEPPPKPSSLSARLSFVFDQIDAIDKQQHQIVSQKDQTLQRIRAWRQYRKPLTDPPPQSEPEPSQLGLGLNSNDKDAANSMVKEEEEKKKKAVVEVVHPWPEWIELMERLVGQNYFDHRRKDEDSLVQELGFDAAEIPGVDDPGIDFTKDFKAVQTACLNFGKDRFDIIRFVVFDGVLESEFFFWCLL
jgi:hypothetical protein